MATCTACASECSGDLHLAEFADVGGVEVLSPALLRWLCHASDFFRFSRRRPDFAKSSQPFLVACVKVVKRHIAVVDLSNLNQVVFDAAEVGEEQEVSRLWLKLEVLLLYQSGFFVAGFRSLNDLCVV